MGVRGNLYPDSGTNTQDWTDFVLRLTNINFTCVMCKRMIERDKGIDNRVCSLFCKAKLLQLNPMKMKKRLNRKKNSLKRQRKMERRQRKALLSMGKKYFHCLAGKPEFYEAREWRELRYAVLKKYDRKCMVCFRTNIELHVDHIEPLSKRPDLALHPDNLQVLCRDCNLGKGNKDSIDWRICP